MELKRKNIAVQLINPGFVKTQLTDKNEFKMPFIITPEQASQTIVRDLFSKKFEIHFPKRFTYILKFLEMLPNGLYVRAMKKLFK